MKIKKVQYEKYPWKRTFYNIQQRCENPNNKDYKYYGLRDIKCLINQEELEYLWNRDSADNMCKPSIDRIDNNGNYELNNCRYIEQSINSKKRGIDNPQGISVFQYDLEDNFIREWTSATEAGRTLEINNSHISACCRHERKKAGGFKWRLK